METMEMVNSLREFLVLYRWLIVKFAKEPKKATLILRLMLLRTRKKRCRQTNKKAVTTNCPMPEQQHNN